MSESTAAVANPPDGEQAMARLADRLAAMGPAPSGLEPREPATEPPSPPGEGTAAPPAPADSAAAAATAEPPARARRRRRSLIGAAVAGFVAACGFIPYALVALALRLVMARAFFLDGQARIEGPRIAYHLHGFDFSAVLPAQVKGETVTAFVAHAGALPLSPLATATLISGAEFILPIMLVLGFGTRLAALGLLAVTTLIQLTLQPDALWTTHVYWAAILLVLLSRGPGQLSLDRVVRWLARR